MSQTTNDDRDTIAVLRGELQRRKHEIELLRETASAVGSELDLDKVFSLIVDRARELIGAETVLLPLLNPGCDEYTYRAGSGANVQEIVGESLPLDFGVCGWVWKHKRPWWRGVLSELSEQEKNLWEKEAGTLLLVPLVGRQHFLGGIAGINKSGGGEFTENDLQLLELFAGQAAIAIENAMAMERVGQAKREAEEAQGELKRVNKRLSAVNQELEYLSLYDNLTGLPNRSLFRDRIRKEIEQHGGAGLALLIIDIDRFQEINDSLGHEAGDELLRVVGALQLTDSAPVATPADWNKGDRVIVSPAMSTEDAKERFGADNVDRGGLRIYTTLDLDLQRASKFVPTKAENYKGIEAAARSGSLL